MGYRPISEYGVIGNDDRIALVHADGSIDWCCFPHVSSPSVFGRLLDAESGGHFAISPTQPHERSMEYIGHTNVLRTRFETTSGSMSLTDFMPVNTTDHADVPQQAIYRKCRCIEGRVPIEIDFAPRLNYARGETSIVKRDGRWVASTADEELTFQVHGPLDLDVRADRVVGYTILEEGDSLWTGVQYEHFTPVPPREARTILDGTIAYWEEWAEEIVDAVTERGELGEWETAIVRSGLVLKLLINEGTGGIYAAATTSLPEAYGGDRNWDYRYNWIRDAKFTIQALFNLGRTDEAHTYFEWFRERAHDAPNELQPVYGVHGERELNEYTLDHFTGYRFSTPVRIGNAATEQRQLDMYGTVVQGMYETIVRDGALTKDDWESITTIADHVCDVWHEKGAGIWEYRTEPRHYLHSKLMCWVALDRTIRLADECDIDTSINSWVAERRAIREAIEEKGYSTEMGSFVQHFDTNETLDASALLIPLYEFLPPDDDRVQATIDTIIEHLTTEEGLVHRTVGPDVPEEGRGTFLFCSFWLVDALALADRRSTARDLFTTILECVDAPHLLAERIDPSTGEYLGNYPQAFSHIGLINSALNLLNATDVAASPSDAQESPHIEPLFRT